MENELSAGGVASLHSLLHFLSSFLLIQFEATVKLSSDHNLKRH